MRHGIAQAQEDFGNLVGDGVDQMARAHLLRAARQRHVDGGRVDGRLELCCGKRRLALLERGLHHAAHLVHRLADGGALLLRHLAHAAQVSGQRAGFAEHRHAHLVKGRRVRRLLDRGERAFPQRRKFVHDCHVSDPFPYRSHPPNAANKKSLPRLWPGISQPKDERRLSRYHLG